MGQSCGATMKVADLERSKRLKKWYVLERHNPQLGVYYTALGQLFKKDAKRREDCLYGTNYIHSFDSEKDYLDFLNKVQKPSPMR